MFYLQVIFLADKSHLQNSGISNFPFNFPDHSSNKKSSRVGLAKEGIKFELAGIKIKMKINELLFICFHLPVCQSNNLLK